jgi:hypothetical protein
MHTFKKEEDEDEAFYLFASHDLVIRVCPGDLWVFQYYDNNGWQFEFGRDKFGQLKFGEFQHRQFQHGQFERDHPALGGADEDIGLPG